MIVDIWTILTRGWAGTIRTLRAGADCDRVDTVLAVNTDRCGGVMRRRLVSVAVSSFAGRYTEKPLVFASDRRAELVRAASGQPRHTLTGHTHPVQAVAVATLPDATAVAITTSRDRTARVWDLAFGQCIQSISLPAAPAALAVGPDGRILIAFGWDIVCFAPSTRTL